MVTPFDGLDPEELAAVGTEVTDPTLRALEIAIYVEDAVDVMLPDRLLADARLCEPDLVTEVLARLIQGR